MPSRRRLACTASKIWRRGAPLPRGPRGGGVPNFLASTRSSRRPRMARPTYSSETPSPYTSAVSMKFTPSASARSTIAALVAASQGRPKVAAPSARADTRRPERPRARYSTAHTPAARARVSHRGRRRARSDDVGVPRRGREQLVEGRAALQQPLLLQVLEERLQHHAVGLEAIG